MLKWAISLFSKERSDLGLQIGSRVRTSTGRGVVTNGCVYVRYDEGIQLLTKSGQKRGINDRTVCHNLNKITLED